MTVVEQRQHRIVLPDGSVAVECDNALVASQELRRFGTAEWQCWMWLERKWDTVMRKVDGHAETKGEPDETLGALANRFRAQLAELAPPNVKLAVILMRPGGGQGIYWAYASTMDEEEFGEAVRTLPHLADSERLKAAGR